MNFRKLFTEIYRRNPPLAITGWVHVGLLVGFLLLLPFDSRTITGINPWIKPIKFAISGCIFLWSIGWITYHLKGRPRRVRVYSWLLSVAMLAEIIIIGLQATRGTTSHFNITSVLNLLLFNMMGLFITVMLIVVILVFIEFFGQQTSLSRPMLWGIRLGLFSLILASLEGFMMIELMAHTVGVVDGGAGLPVVNWSTVAGDLRVAHFIGMHGLQVFPLTAYLISRLFASRSVAVQTSLVLSAAVLYLLLMNFTLWQALSKLPLIRL